MTEQIPLAAPLAADRTPTVFSDGAALHSRYNPSGEAEKYVHSLGIPQTARILILIEPALGYSIPVLRAAFPDARIIALHVSDFFREHRAPGADPSAQWFPSDGLPLERFLEREVGEREAAQIRLVEWRPALAAYGRAYARLLADTAAFIRRADAGARTVRAFGRRWFRNALKNLRLARNVARCRPTAAPCVVTGAGPSLEAALPRIRDLRAESGAFIIATASSAAALGASGLAPDLVITTDGGSWARLHLYEALRGRPLRSCVLAASLNAALPAQCAEVPLLILSDGSRWQRAVLERLGIPHIPLIQRGTVTAQALDLAFALTSGPVFIAGMDLANRDIRTHARPYAFDRLQEERATRLTPAYSARYERARDLASGGSYGVYAGWFSGQLAAYPKRLFTLGGNHRAFDGLPRMPTAERAATAAAETTRSVPLDIGVMRIDAPDPAATAVDTLLAALERGDEGMREELAALLFPDGGSAADAADALALSAFIRGIQV
jgi:hypothetical protein